MTPSIKFKNFLFSEIESKDIAIKVEEHAHEEEFSFKTTIFIAGEYQTFQYTSIEQFEQLKQCVDATLQLIYKAKKNKENKKCLKDQSTQRVAKELSSLKSASEFCLRV